MSVPPVGGTLIVAVSEWDVSEQFERQVRAARPWVLAIPGVFVAVLVAMIIVDALGGTRGDLVWVLFAGGLALVGVAGGMLRMHRCPHCARYMGRHVGRHCPLCGVRVRSS